MSRMLTPDEVAARMGVSKRHLFDLLRRGEFPPPSLVVNRKVRRWRESLIEAIEKGQWTPKEKA